jgi:hypothetical protein
MSFRNLPPTLRFCSAELSFDVDALDQRLDSIVEKVDL